VFSLRAIVFWTLLACSTAALAQDEPSLSFAFASQAGSGIYSVEGRMVQIYRVPVAFTVRPLTDDRVWGAAVTLPLTFGFYDYKAADALNGQFPTHIGTASLLPGVEFNVRATKNWIITPHVDFGAAKDFSGDNLVWVYDLGVRSVVSFPISTWDARAGQELLWAGAAQTGTPLTDWYGKAQAGFEFRHELPGSSTRTRWDVGVFIVYDRYFKGTAQSTAAVTFSAAATPGVDEQTEIGISFGTRPTLAWKQLSLPKLGLSYLFGDGIHGARLVIGEVFEEKGTVPIYRVQPDAGVHGAPPPDPRAP
jgi:hypothetical protein